MEKLLNTKEAAKITGYSVYHIRWLAAHGKVKSARVPPEGHFRFLKEDLMNLTHAPAHFPAAEDPKKKPDKKKKS